jgi:hypothetical protein
VVRIAGAEVSLGGSGSSGLDILQVVNKSVLEKHSAEGAYSHEM